MMFAPRHLRLAAFLAAASVMTAGANAQVDGPLYTGHAIPGSTGFESSLKPPRGVSYENLLYLYNSEIERDRDGNETGSGGSVRHASNHFSIVWGSPWKIFGGDYAMKGVLGLGNGAPNARSLDAGNRGFKLLDTYIEPFSLHWPGETGWATLKAGYWFDTGDFEAGNLNSSGKGFQTFELAFGFTYYPYKERRWHLSTMTRWGQHSKVDGLDLRPGDDIVIDWSFGKHLNDRWNAGLVGYGVWQTSRDKGADANVEIGFYGVAALGLGARYELPDWGGHAEVRVYQEFNAFNHTEGQAGLLALSFRL